MTGYRFTSLSALLIAAVFAAGCGLTPSTGMPARMSRKMPISANPGAPRLADSGTLVANNGATRATGTLVLKLSSLQSFQVLATREDVAELEVKLVGNNLAQPLVKRLSARELKTSNTIAFEGVPSGQFTVSLAAFDAQGANIGQKSTVVTVTPNDEVAVKLQLKLNPSVVNGTGKVKFDFDIVDGDVIEAPAASAPAQPEEPDNEGVLAIEVTDKKVVRKLMLLKRLAVTVKITNKNTTESLSGQVKIDFVDSTGLIRKQMKVVETQTASVTNLAPGASKEVTLTSTKSAIDAEATVHTVLSSATAE